MKALVIGAGLGGLLSGARLGRAGYEVEVFERLPMIGGRFTNIEYKGFKLSTGALHMIPHGYGGPLAQLLSEVGADVKIVRPSPLSMIRIPKKKGDSYYKEGYIDIPFSGFKDQFSMINQLKLARLLVTTRINPPKEGTFGKWISRNIKEEWAFKIADAFCGWSLSMGCFDVSTKEAFAIFENLYSYGGSGIPIGGCGAVVDALADVITSNGGVIHTGTDVSEVIIRDNSATGVVVNNVEYSGDVIISDIGHLETSRLCNGAVKSGKHTQYLEKIRKIVPSAGVKICLSGDEPLIGHGGVILTPNARRINGMNEVTNIDPGLAPPGKHLLMSHMCVQQDRLNDLEEEIDLGLHDLEEMFAGKKYEVLLIQSHSGGWPVNRSASGLDVGNKTPFPNLYIVGDGAKGEGGIEVEGIALGVSATMDMILGQV
jgi:phytoene dehydrogenase-like protein